MCSAGNPALVAAPRREERAEKQAYRDRFSNLKNESRILRGLLSFGEGRLGALRVDGWGGHPVIDMEVDTVPIG